MNLESTTDVATALNALCENVQKVFLGKPEAVQMAAVALLADGHVLIEDVPGVGKTILARALARSIDCRFKRIQFTPDLLPSDILGVSVFNVQKEGFEFKPGPIFANIILADEINRTTPRTQSSLLEAMNDFQVSLDGITRPLDRPFMVMATQNPFEFEGTYALPESEVDRFLIRISIGYPSQEDEREILMQRQTEDPLDRLTPAMSAEDVLGLQARARAVRIDDALLDYLLKIVDGTRQSDRIELGASPRASIFLMRAAQACALLDGREYCLPDDIKRMASPVLAHRLILARGQTGGDEAVTAALLEVLDAVPVPL